MKRILFSALAATLFVWSCKEDPTQSEQYKQLEETNQSISAESGMKDSTINNMFGAFNRISENLRAIREKQGLLVKGDGGVESGADMETRIISDLGAIDSLLAENKKLIARMRKDAKAQGGKIAELQKTIDELERTIGERDAEISTLKEQLASTNASLASMIQMYQDKDQLATMQRSELNTAWYCVGTKKELTENGVLTKEGGFIGIGKVQKLNTESMNKDYFKQVDITQVMEVPINGKKAKVVTSHPAGSYKFEGAVDKLVITDATKFWSVSKYLVVMVD
ncbi:MAG: hypothetical protein JNL05_03995 [Flavobacteriales bacterium]|nr:hypothetical protein [Flavobacteriales bacterium]